MTWYEKWNSYTAWQRWKESYCRLAAIKLRSEHGYDKPVQKQLILNWNDEAFVNQEPLNALADNDAKDLSIYSQQDDAMRSQAQQGAESTKQYRCN